MPQKRLMISSLLFLTLLLLFIQPLTAQEAPLPLPGRQTAPRAYISEQILTAPVPEFNDRYGISLAIEGSVMLVGAPYENNDAGTVFVYERDSVGTWVQTAALIPDTPGLANLLGWSVDLDGSLAAIGAPTESAVYIFQRSSTGTWTQQQKIQSSALNGLGSKVVLRDAFLAVQAYHANTVEIYQQDSNQVWQFQSSIELMNVGGYSYSPFAFDGSTFLQGGTASVDGRGEVLVREFDGTDWTITQRLRSTNGSSYFGFGVALTGNQAIIASENSSNAPVGGFEVFEKQNGIWTSIQYVSTGDGAGGYGPSFNLLAKEGHVLIGNYYNSVVSIYRFNGTEWVFEDRAIHLPPSTNYFGYGLDLSGDTLVSSAPFGIDGGRVYVYERLDFEPVELLVNGGFESGETGWTLKNGSGDKVKCADATTSPDKVAQEGNCAFVFKGSTGEDARLKQSIKTELPAGVTIGLGGFVKLKGEQPFGEFKIIVKYAADSLPNDKVVGIIAPFYTGVYLPIANYGPTLLAIQSATKSVKVNINNRGQSGKVSYDGLSLVAR